MNDNLGPCFKKNFGWFLGLPLVGLLGCFGLSQPNPDHPSQKDPLGTALGFQEEMLSSLPRLSREDFNRLAALMNIPLFWHHDSSQAKLPEAQEITVLGAFPDREAFVTQNQLNQNFWKTYRFMIEHKRQESIALELNQGRVTLVETDLSTISEFEKKMVEEILKAARVIEELFAHQNGSHPLTTCFQKDDAISQALFRRNQGPWCEAPATQLDPFCNACPSFPPNTTGLYPKEFALHSNFCDTLAKHPASDELLNPFVVVEGDEKNLHAVPYNQKWPDLMNQVARHLKQAARVIPSDQENAFKNYLQKAAWGFENNSWEAVDEAWTGMNAKNSRWYLRVAPDEVYFEPCGRKAGFHLVLAQIDSDSLYWQDKLTPLRQEMEAEIAALIGEPYQARQVSFQMPDFISIVLNAGDARAALGATIGQSLPNWGKVAQEGRGRTVVMSNLYTDPDSIKATRNQADSLFDKASMEAFCDNKRLSLLDIILHEAMHNLGPHSDYQVHGKTPGQIFGGAQSSVLEELKAQTGAMYLVDFLVRHHIITDQQAQKVYHHAINWCFGHISRGMHTAEGRPKPYSYVAAIHIGTLIESKALTWETDRLANNGSDRGHFSFHAEKIPESFKGLMQKVGRILAKADVKTANELIDHFIHGKAHALLQAGEITERVLRFPKASFVYSVKL